MLITILISNFKRRFNKISEEGAFLLSESFQLLPKLLASLKLDLKYFKKPKSDLQLIIQNRNNDIGDSGMEHIAYSFYTLPEDLKILSFDL